MGQEAEKIAEIRKFAAAKEAEKIGEIRKFAAAEERIKKAVIRMAESVGHVKDAFAPVMAIDGRTPGENKVEDRPKDPSQFDAFIYSVEDQLFHLAGELDYICERSQV